MQEKVIVDDVVQAGVGSQTFFSQAIFCANDSI